MESDVVRCSDLNSRITAAISQFIDEMEDLNVPSDLFRRRAYWEQYRRAHRVTARHARGGRLLDWGAGVGHFGFVQSLLGSNVTAYTVGIDGAGPYELALAGVVSRAGIEHVTSPDPVALPFPNDHFDVIVSCGVLEHVREFGGDDRASMVELARILRPGGTFVCFHLPNQWSLGERLRKRAGRSHHAFTYSRADFLTLAQHSGMQVDASFRYGVLPANSFASRISGRAARVAGSLDRLLSVPLGVIGQNHAFVCRKT